MVNMNNASQTEPNCEPKVIKHKSHKTHRFLLNIIDNSRRVKIKKKAHEKFCAATVSAFG